MGLCPSNQDICIKLLDESSDDPILSTGKTDLDRRHETMRFPPPLEDLVWRKSEIALPIALIPATSEDRTRSPLQHRNGLLGL